MLKQPCRVRRPQRRRRRTIYSRRRERRERAAIQSREQRPRGFLPSLLRRLFFMLFCAPVTEQAWTWMLPNPFK